ncbi:hypothetical protein BMS3Abin07_00479 [bacterium BMS3Abin07]|nr:hypothetical protein BMS3Abin07_00479 [bacterium BMS3Abin07]GBE31638.1 hypothetical protein BMS3Bbin05_00541 [bacterium BMS3Bbin05]HDO21328.1 hypothetical protein [Nitrospirota bacterium]
MVTPKELHKKTSRVVKDVYLKEDNILKVKVKGKTGTFVEVSIYKAELNVPVCNRTCDLEGSNLGPPYGILLYWSREVGTKEYIFYRAFSSKGPWEKIFDLPGDYWSGAAVDVTPYLTEREHCYRIEAVNEKGRVIRKYEPVCVRGIGQRTEGGK